MLRALISKLSPVGSSADLPERYCRDCGVTVPTVPVDGTTDSGQDMVEYRCSLCGGSTGVRRELTDAEQQSIDELGESGF